jgi:hypothetical protein
MTDNKPTPAGEDDAMAFDRQMIEEFNATDGASVKQSNRLLWERREDETSKAFAAFREYLDLGGGRSLAKVGRKLGKSTKLIERWSAANEWVRRAEAFDNEQDRLYFAELKNRRREMAERHASEAQSLQAVAMAGLRKKFGQQLEKLKDDGDAELTATEILRFFIEASKLERIALGEPSDIIEEQHTGGLNDERDRKPVVPLTFAGRIEQAVDLLETARTRAGLEGAEQSD